MIALKSFIIEIIDHFSNRASQREKLAFRTYDIHRNAPDGNSFVREPLPVAYGIKRGLQPDDTTVLVGFYKSHEHLSWIRKNNLYNFRMAFGAGSLPLDATTVNARYLLLHTYGDDASGELWMIDDRGPRVFSKDDLSKMGYLNPTRDNYLVFKIRPLEDLELQGRKWSFKKLKNFETGRQSASPFTTNLTELMQNVV